MWENYMSSRAKKIVILKKIKKYSRKKETEQMHVRKSEKMKRGRKKQIKKVRI
jgi:hypothetical protein